MDFFANKNFIIISSVDWNMHNQLHHELVYYLKKNNNKILFIENMGTRNIQYRDISRIGVRIKNFIKSWGGFKVLDKSLTIFSPLFIPIHGLWLFDKFNSFYINNKLSKWLSHFNFKKPIIILFAPNPISLSILDKINYDFLVYYVADDMLLSAKSNRATINNCEKSIIKRSDLIIYTSKNLKKKFTKYNKNHHYLSNGVNIDKFKNINFTEKKINKVFTIGFVGAIRSTIDEKLIIFLAKNFPNDHFVFVGPIIHPLKKILQENLKNIFFYGEINHYQIPKVMKSFDIGLLPLKKDKFTNSIFPLKLYEYLASGIPVISSATRTMIEFDFENRKSIFVCKSFSEFVKKIKYIKNKNFLKKNVNKNKMLAIKNSWKIKFLEFEQLVCSKYFSVYNKNTFIYEKILKFYKLQKIKIVKFVFLSFLIFISLFFFINSKKFLQYFVVNSNNKNYQNVIVITGYGHRLYQNISYQFRLSELIDYNNELQFKNIIIINRSGLFDEGMAMVKMLPENFNNKNIILIADRGSAYNNILELKNILKKNSNLDSIKYYSIISEENFSRRFSLLVKKNIPDIEIDFLPSKHNSQKYFTLFYEILAIIKYKINNYL